MPLDGRYFLTIALKPYFPILFPTLFTSFPNKFRWTTAVESVGSVSACSVVETRVALTLVISWCLPPAHLIQVYCSLVRPILEYASPVWAALLNCLVQLVESVQKSALGIISPDCSYESALVRCGLPTLLSPRDEACRRFISNIKESGFLSHLLPQPTNVAHWCGLRSGFPVLNSALSERTALVILLLTVTIGLNCFCLLCHV